MGWGLNKLRNAEQKDLGEPANEKLYVANDVCLQPGKTTVSWAESKAARPECSEK